MLIGWQPCFSKEIILKKIIFENIVCYSYCYLEMNFHKIGNLGTLIIWNFD